MYLNIITLREHTGTQFVFPDQDILSAEPYVIAMLPNITQENRDLQITWYLGMFKIEVLPEEKIPGNNTYMIACRVRVGADILFDDTFTYTRPYPIGGSQYELDPLVDHTVVSLVDTRFAIQQLYVYGVGMQQRSFEAHVRDSIQLNFYAWFNQVRMEYTKLKPVSTYMAGVI